MVRHVFIYLVCSILLLSTSVFAQFVPISMWQKSDSPALVFTTSAASFYNRLCSPVVTVQATSDGSTPELVGSNLTVSLSSAAGLTYYSDSTCTTAITDVTITTGTSTASYYFHHTGTGGLTQTASATGYSNGSITHTLTSNPFLWTGSGGPIDTWATGANWSGGVAPGSSDVATFDGSCSSNCSPDIAAGINVGGIYVHSDYSGTISQTGGHIQVSQTDGFIFNGGTFTGDSSGSYNVDLYRGPMAIMAGTFTFPAGDFTVNHNYTASNSATVTVPSGANLEWVCASSSYNCQYEKSMTPGTHTYQNLIIQGRYDQYNLNGGTMTVSGNLTFGRTLGSLGRINNGTFNVSGDITQTGAGYSGTAVVNLVGNASGSTISGDGDYFPILVINTGTHPVTLSNQIQTHDYTYTSSGTFTTTGSTLEVFCINTAEDCIGTPDTLDLGTNTYHNLEIKTRYASVDMNGRTVTVTGDLTIGDNIGTTSTISDGEIRVQGDITLNVGGYRRSAADFQITAIGNAGGSTITGLANRIFPLLVIDAGTNPITLAGTLRLDGYDYIASGTFDAGTSTVEASCRDGNICQSGTGNFDFGSVTYNNVTIIGRYADYDLQGSAVKTTGTLSIGSTLGSGERIDNGSLEPEGNFVVTNLGFDGNASITLRGSANQNIDAGGRDIPQGTFTVNKSGGTATLISNLLPDATGQDFTITNGTVDMNGNSLTVADVLTIGTGTTLTQGGGSLSYGSLVNNGTLNP